MNYFPISADHARLARRQRAATLANLPILTAALSEVRELLGLDPRLALYVPEKFGPSVGVGL